MSDETTEKSGKTWHYVVGLLVGAPLCYVLSIGPAAVLFLRGYAPKPLVASIYAPLDWAIPYSSPPGRLLAGYIGLWLQLTGTPKP
jgi:hypothetical protein